MKITNKLGLPKGFVDACSTEQHNAENELSATTLLNGVKETILTKRHWDELEVDVSDEIFKIFGKAVHSLFEKEGDTDFCEEELREKVGRYELKGKFDNYDLKTGVVTDYKTASVWKIKFADFEDWKNQGLIYSWLLKKNGFEVSKCRFIALLKDHSKTEVSRDYSYPKSPVYIYEFNVTKSLLDEIEKFIKLKIGMCEISEKLSDDEIAHCSEKERWEQHEKFAVKKEGRKSAVKIFYDLNDAENCAADLGKFYYVEHRKGISRKCRDYCLCNKFCNFYKSEVENESN